MLIGRTLPFAATALLAVVASASSTVRNPLTRLGLVRNPDILTQNHRVTAVSHFDVAFDVDGTRIRLSLEPNDDIFPEGARITYLDAEGNVAREEPIQRQEHKIYRGESFVKRGDRWDRAGWARISMRRDGTSPLFEGAFTLYHDHHHVQLAANYKRTRQSGDPDIDLRDDEHMVVFRDSDISTAPEHTELRKRSGGGLSCPSDELEYNMDPQHPVFSSMGSQDMTPRDDSWFNPLTSFARRQVDTTPGGNGAGINLLSSIGSTDGCPTTRKVALVGVAVDCNYRSEFKSENETRENIITQMNAASNLFESTFKISLGLANLIVTDPSCPTTPQQSTPWNRPCSGDFNIQARLNTFSSWRGQQDDDYSHWTLLSTCKSGPAIGLAWLGQACTVGSQANGNNQDESVAGANVVVRTSQEWQVIAHETGHTFGAVHDCTAELCANNDIVSAQQCCPLNRNQCNAGESFIMNPSTAQGIKNFSPCSIGNICAALGRNSVKSNCLTNNRGVVTVTGQTCGNGIVEGDEQCDCGGPEGCGNNACCNPETCQLRENAVCDDSNEDCCRDCQFASASTVCRPSSGVCDPEEKCPGDGPYCPEDKTKPNGDDCGDGLECASGQCTSRDLQCKTVMGNYGEGNDTYACDNSNCQLSCGSPEFQPGMCVGLQQNFLDGTPCGMGGRCKNGQCDGSSLGNEVKSWIENHKPLVIGLASAIGSLIILSILGCCWRSYRRRKNHKKYAAAAAAYRGQQPPPNYPPGAGGAGRQHRAGGRRVSRRRSHQPLPSDATGVYAPPPGPPGGSPNGYGEGGGGYGQGQPQWGGGGGSPPMQQRHDIPQPPPIFQRGESVRYA